MRVFASELLNDTGRVDKQQLMSGRPTFEDPLTMQEVPGDNHCVEVLGEAWCAWRFDGLAQLTLLGNEKKKGRFVKHQQIDCDHRVSALTGFRRALVTLNGWL